MTRGLAWFLDALVRRLDEAAKSAQTEPFGSCLLPPIDPEALALAECAVGRQLPGEVQELYRWHNGGGSASVFPSIHFGSLAHALEAHLSLASFPLPPVSNGGTDPGVGDLLPVFDSNLDLCAELPRPGEPASHAAALYCVDLERDQLTRLSTSLLGFVQHVLFRLDHVGLVRTDCGLVWADEDWFAFPSPAMEPWHATDDGPTAPRR